MTPTPQAQLETVTEAARFFQIAVSHFVMDAAGVPSESCIACAGWMAGTQLFRMEVGLGLDVPRGTVVLSEGVNQRLPALLASVAQRAGEGVAAEPGIEEVSSSGTPPRLRFSLAQTQDALDPIYQSYARRSALTSEQMLQAAVLAAGLVAGNGRRVLGLSCATHIAQYCMLEASKTAARKLEKHDYSRKHLRRFASILPLPAWLQNLRKWLGRTSHP